MLDYLFEFLMAVCAFMMIVLVLLQRGKGGGLAGAFGGMGGQSAFGTKAGDAFTKVTIGLAIFWILICILAAKFGGSSAKNLINVPNVVANPAAPAQGAAPGPANTTTGTSSGTLSGSAAKGTVAAVAADSTKPTSGTAAKLGSGPATEALPEPSSGLMPSMSTNVKPAGTTKPPVVAPAK